MADIYTTISPYNGDMFKDHFSGHANNYSRYRPDYPAALFEHLVALCDERQMAWDCATGSGQAARMLAKHFGQVIASDASQPQLQQAVPASNVHYTAALAEASGIATDCIDLLTVAQSLHWFDFERFGAESRRVLKPGGVLAAWCYGLLEIDSKIDPLIEHFYTDTVGRYWPAERAHVDSAYRNITLPLPELADARFHIELRWDLDTLLGYVRTWSACQRCQGATGADPVKLLDEQLQDLWGERHHERDIRWPILLRAWRNA